MPAIKQKSSILADQAKSVMNPASDGEKPVRVIQSVDRALSLLELLAAQNGPIALGEIAQAVGLNTSTCHHLISTLVARGFVLHAGRSRGYMLSSKLMELSELSGREFDLAEFVAPDLRALNEKLLESVQMAVLRGSSLVTQVRFGSHMPTHVEPDEIKKMRASHAAATGKAILAWLPETEIARVVAENGLTAFTENTITSLSGLIEELRLVRRTGFSVDDEELENDVVCFGAALRDGSGAVVGSISVSIPKVRATPEHRDYMARSVKQCARALSDRLRVNRH